MVLPIRRVESDIGHIVAGVEPGVNIVAVVLLLLMWLMGWYMNPTVNYFVRRLHQFLLASDSLIAEMITYSPWAKMLR